MNNNSSHFVNRHRSLFFILKGLRTLKASGVKTTFYKTSQLLKRTLALKKLSRHIGLTDDERQREERTVFPKDVRFSLLVPLYNTPITLLDEMITSVQAQTYKNWELCLADGSDEQHNNVGEECRHLAARDPRIKYKKLDRNEGISGNTNQCIAMASGEYLSLFDHDDLLHPSALYETMKSICEQNSDFIYTDEAVFANTVQHLVTAYFKPDFAIDTLRSNNYICHFTTFSRDLLQQVGSLRSECNGSQDHDLILRLTEKARRVVHIPKLLYFWRSTSGSTSQDISSKPYVAAGGIRAVTDSLKRNHLPGTVESSEIFPAIYRMRYALREQPVVSIIIRGDRENAAQVCAASIAVRTTYPAYEIIPGSRKCAAVLKGCNNAQKRLKVIDLPETDNAALVRAVRAAGPYLLFLDAGCEVITPDWIEELLMFAQRTDVGAVGGKIYFHNDTIFSAGIILGLGIDGTAGSRYYKTPRADYGYMGNLCFAQNLSAVSSCCMMVKKEVFLKAGGLDDALSGILQDTDFCLKLRKVGLLNVYTPYAELSIADTPVSAQNCARHRQEVSLFKKRWASELAAGDPYYNPNFALDRGTYSFKS